MRKVAVIGNFKELVDFISSLEYTTSTNTNHFLIISNNPNGLDPNHEKYTRENIKVLSWGEYGKQFYKAILKGGWETAFAYSRVARNREQRAGRKT